IDTNPDASWSLDRLSQFVQKTMRRLAVDAWQIGKALAIARDKLKVARGYDAWVKERGLSKMTAHRYVKLAEAFSLEEIRGKPLVQVYRQLDLVPPPKPKASMQKTSPFMADHDPVTVQEL